MQLFLIGLTRAVHIIQAQVVWHLVLWSVWKWKPISEDRLCAAAASALISGKFRTPSSLTICKTNWLCPSSDCEESRAGEISGRKRRRGKGFLLCSRQMWHWEGAYSSDSPRWGLFSDTHELSCCLLCEGLFCASSRYMVSLKKVRDSVDNNFFF